MSPMAHSPSTGDTAIMNWVRPLIEGGLTPEQIAEKNETFAEFWRDLTATEGIPPHVVLERILKSKPQKRCGCPTCMERILAAKNSITFVKVF